MDETALPGGALSADECAPPAHGAPALPAPAIRSARDASTTAPARSGTERAMGTAQPFRTGTAALLVNDEGQYLLHLRDANKREIHNPGTWSLIGGAPEPGETPQETITRELWEKAELEIPDLVPFVLLEDTCLDGDTKGHIQVYLGRWNGEAATLPLTEGIMLHWFSADVMPRLTMCEWAEEVILKHQADLQCTANSASKDDRAPVVQQP
ncbi:NUDIX domain-containing protein [Streptomyces inhibens]|uniref:NUDIX domain-containing protein n=1 Tax=Streptomyces inhibens TaxID=2293571 RepID=UPI0036A1E100